MNTRTKAYEIAKELRALNADAVLDLRVKFTEKRITICCEHTYEAASFAKIEDEVGEIIAKYKVGLAGDSWSAGIQTIKC